jgi:hypothetical protein
MTLDRLARALLAVTAGLALLAPAGALARHGGDDGRQEVRVAGQCGRGATSKLKLKERDGGIQVEFEVDQNRSGVRWRVSLSSEGRVVYRGTRRTGGSSGSFSLERTISDLPGADTVRARGVGPRGLTCQASATLPGN